MGKSVKDMDKNDFIRYVTICVIADAIAIGLAWLLGSDAGVLLGSTAIGMAALKWALD